MVFVFLIWAISNIIGSFSSILGVFGLTLWIQDLFNRSMFQISVIPWNISVNPVDTGFYFHFLDQCWFATLRRLNWFSWYFQDMPDMIQGTVGWTFSLLIKLFHASLTKCCEGLHSQSVSCIFMRSIASSCRKSCHNKRNMIFLNLYQIMLLIYKI